MSNNLVLGIDVGIASVGWGVIDENFQVRDAGVRLFTVADASQNQERRTFRQIRRLKRRRLHRLERTRSLLNGKVEISNPARIKVVNPVEVRCRGLAEKLEKEELYFILCNYMKHRGASYLDEDDVEDSKNASGYANAIALNKKEIDEKKYPCKIQSHRLNTLGKYRGDIIEENEAYSNVFTKSSYVEEIKQILDTNQKYHSFITDEFKEQYLEIFMSKREYYVGPGNELSRTDYGIYRTNGEKWENLFQVLIGKCSIYSDELRASKASYTAERFNVLNDLNNISVKNARLTYDQKTEILNKILNAKKAKSVMKTIAETCNCEESQITGNRINKKDEPEFHKFEIHRKMRNEMLDKLGLNIQSISIKLLDKIAHDLTINTERDAIKKALDRLAKEDTCNILTTELIDFLVEFRKKNGTMFSGWHSFSLKIMYELMPYLENESKNQSEILHELKLYPTKTKEFQDCNEIPAKVITDEIFNPVVSKSINQVIGIINALVKKYGNFKDIVIEMPREDNDEERKRNISNMQKKNSELIGKIESDLLNNYGINMTEQTYRNNKGLQAKLKLWWGQNKKCLYSGKDISPQDLISNPNMFDVDHIIPISISFDDSQSNKVVVFSSENRLKTNTTPYYYLKTKSSEWNYQSYKAYVTDLFKEKRINKKKLSLLLFEGDIQKQDVLQGFISRNLNDTRYIAKTVLNSLQDYVKVKKLDTKIKVVNGAFTSQFRKNLKLEKDREESYAHHAVDALICALSSLGFNKYMINKKAIIDFETGEILDHEKYSQMLEEDKYKEQMFAYNKFDMKRKLESACVAYSYKVNKKPNRAISDQTIYSSRNVDGTDYTVDKIKDIYDKKEYARFKKLYDKDKTKFLMYKNDRKTWDKLEKVIQMYPDAKDESPFKLYKDEFGKLTKYAKKDNGAEITTLKYLSDKLGNHINISHKYDTKNKKVFLLSLKPYTSHIFKLKGENKFKLLRLNYSDFKFKGSQYVLPKEMYEDKKQKLKIDDSYEFMFALYKDDIIEIKYQGEDVKKYRYSSCPYENGSQITVKPIDKKDFEKLKTLSLGKFEDITKINTDILGKEHRTKKENNFTV